MLPTYKAAIFDMDGTIVDNMQHHVDVWLALAPRLGTTLTRERFEREFAGKKNEEIIPALSTVPLAAEDIERFAQEKEAAYRAAYAPELRPLPGLRQILAALKERGIVCALATAAPEANRKLVLDGLGLHASFTAIVGAEAVTHGKPHPEIYLRTAEVLGQPPAACLVFEDAQNGIRAARAAGMEAVGVLTTRPANELEQAGARWTIENYEKLPKELMRALQLAS